MAEWPYGTRTWQRLRAAKLSTDPLCYACEMRGRIVPAVAVDHVVAIKRGGPPFPPLDGLMSLCEPCHNSKTATFDRGSGRTTADTFGRRFKGFDVHGNPIDREDDWHGGGGGRNRGRSPGRGPSWGLGKYLVS